MLLLSLLISLPVIKGIIQTQIFMMFLSYLFFSLYFHILEEEEDAQTTVLTTTVKCRILSCKLGHTT